MPVPKDQYDVGIGASRGICSPGCDLQRHHDEFIEDEGRKGYRHDVQELRLEQH